MILVMVGMASDDSYDDCGGGGGGGDGGGGSDGDSSNGDGVGDYDYFINMFISFLC